MANHHKNTVKKLFDRLKGVQGQVSAGKRVETIEISELESAVSAESKTRARIETEILRSRIAEKTEDYNKENKSSD